MSLVTKLSDKDQRSLDMLRSSPDELITKERLARGEIYLSDSIKHLMAVFSKKEIIMPTRSEPWHVLFYRASKKDNAPKALKEVFFEAGGRYPRARALDELLHNFVVSGVLTTWSPRFRTYTIDGVWREYWLEQLGVAPSKYKHFIKEVSHQAKREFGPFTDSQLLRA